MRLFFTVLQAVTELRMPFSIEILVDEAFETVHKGKISGNINPVGYRLWVPATPMQRTALRDCIIGALTPRKEADLDRPKYHKKRQRGVSHACATPFKYIDDLEQSISAYFSHSGVDTSRDFIDLLGVSTFFTAPGYSRRVRSSSLSMRQAKLESYTSSTKTFQPCDYLTEHGLMRSYTTGPGGLLIASAEELLSYLLPAHEPTRDVLVAKIIRMSTAAGQDVCAADLAGLTTDEIVRRVDLNKDPTVYSPVYVDDDAAIAGTVLASIVAAEYHIVHSLASANSTLLDHYRTAKSETAISSTYTAIADQLCMLLCAPPIKGIPAVYGRMYKEGEELLKRIKGPADSSLVAQRLWSNHRTQDTRRYTPASHGVNWLVMAAHECLRLFAPQKVRCTCRMSYIRPHDMSLEGCRLSVRGIFGRYVAFLVGTCGIGSNRLFRLFRSPVDGICTALAPVNFGDALNVRSFGGVHLSRTQRHWEIQIVENGRCMHARMHGQGG